jgi:hypothetical protein
VAAAAKELREQLEFRVHGAAKERLEAKAAKERLEAKAAKERQEILLLI